MASREIPKREWLNGFQRQDLAEMVSRMAETNCVRLEDARVVPLIRGYAMSVGRFGHFNVYGPAGIGQNNLTSAGACRELRRLGWVDNARDILETPEVPVQGFDL